jgi:hypothetical protein
VESLKTEEKEEHNETSKIERAVCTCEMMMMMMMMKIAKHAKSLSNTEM